MNKKLEQMLSAWDEKHSELKKCKFSKEKVREIAINCISLSKAWISSSSCNSKYSYEVLLHGKDGEVIDTLHGVTANNLADLMLDVLTVQSDTCSKLSVNAFYFNNGKKIVKEIGTLDINS